MYVCVCVCVCVCDPVINTFIQTFGCMSIQCSLVICICSELCSISILVCIQCIIEAIRVCA